jgi:hypothetical protein
MLRVFPPPTCSTSKSATKARRSAGVRRKNGSVAVLASNRPYISKKRARYSISSPLAVPTKQMRGRGTPDASMI